MLRHTTLCAFVVVIVGMGAAYAQGRNGVCGGLSGNAFGLCNAYCEAKSCYSSENYGSPSCTQLRSNLERLPGSPEMPCGDDSTQAALPSTASCPCNFDGESWTNNETQILKRSDLSLCTGDFNNCITCDIKNGLFGSFTSLSVLVNLFDGSFPEPEDSLFFFITEPSDLAGGTCGVDVSFAASGTPITTEDPVSIEQFPACISDIGALQSAYVALCSQSPPR